MLLYPRYISCQFQTDDHENYFRHENLSYPSLLCHEHKQCTLFKHTADTPFLPGFAKTFHAYATGVIFTDLCGHLQ